MRPARPPIPEETGRLNSKGRPSSLSQEPTGTNLATATAEYTKNLELQHACPRVRVRGQAVNKRSEALTLGGSVPPMDESSRAANDGYSANAIAAQLSMTGLEIAEMYTRTCIELCMRNYVNE